MTTLILIVAGIIFIVYSFFTAWSHHSLKQSVEALQKDKPVDKMFIEHISYTRSSLNVIYASIAIITFVLAFLGVNAEADIAEKVKTEILSGKEINLDSLKLNAEEAGKAFSAITGYLAQTKESYQKVKNLADKSKAFEQHLFVVQGIPISKEKAKYSFSELKTVTGENLPTFTKPPLVLCNTYAKTFRSLEVVVITSKEGFKCSTYDEPFQLDLWIYGL